MSLFYVQTVGLKLYIIIHSGCNLACIFMKERVNIHFTMDLVCPLFNVLSGYWSYFLETVETLRRPCVLKEIRTLKIVNQCNQQFND